jgi:FCD domain
LSHRTVRCACTNAHGATARTLARLAAERGAERAKTEGPAFLEEGRAAVQSGSLHEQIEADMRFHAFVKELSGIPLIGETTAPHWPYLRRVMGEGLRGGGSAAISGSAHITASLYFAVWQSSRSPAATPSHTPQPSIASGTMLLRSQRNGRSCSRPAMCGCGSPQSSTSRPLSLASLRSVAMAASRSGPADILAMASSSERICCATAANFGTGVRSGLGRLRARTGRPLFAAPGAGPGLDAAAAHARLDAQTGRAGRAAHSDPSLSEVEPVSYQRLQFPAGKGFAGGETEPRFWATAARSTRQRPKSFASHSPKPRKVKDNSDGARKPQLRRTAWWGW